MTKKDVFVEKMKARLDEWSADIDIIQAKAEKVEAGLKSDYAEQVAELESKRSAAKKLLVEIKSSSNEAWTELRSGIEGSWSEIESALKEFKNKFS